MNQGSLDGKAVQLSGREEDLKHLASHFCFDDFCVFQLRFTLVNPASSQEEEHTEYYLKSKSFDTKTDDAEICSEAVDLIALINGEAQIEVGIYSILDGKSQGGPDFEPVRADSVVNEFRGGQKLVTKVLVGTATARLLPSDFLRLLEVQGVEISEDEKNNIRKREPKSRELAEKQEKLINSRFPILELAGQDENVREALTYYGYQHSWDNLYRTWDVIKKDMKYRSSTGWGRTGFRQYIRGSLIDGNEKRFSQTANFHHHGGPGREKNLPAKPMDLDEAEFFMRVLMVYWLNWKHDNLKTN